MSSSTIIPTRRASVTVNNTDLDKMMEIIRDNSTQLLTEHIQHTPLRTVEGLLAATKPLTTPQIRQLHLLGLSLYCAARGRRTPSALKADKIWLGRKPRLDHGHPLIRTYRDPRFSLWFQHILCCLELIRAEAALES